MELLTDTVARFASPMKLYGNDDGTYTSVSYCSGCHIINLLLTVLTEAGISRFLVRINMGLSSSLHQVMVSCIRVKCFAYYDKIYIENTIPHICMIQNHRKEYTIILLPFLLASIFAGGLLLLSTTASLGYASTSNGNNNSMTTSPSSTLLPDSYSSSAPSNPYATLTLTPNMIAAGGPIPPNYTIAQQEAECAAALENPGWYRTLSPAEHHDSARSEMYPCSQFPGSFTGPNDVYAYPSPLNTYITPFSMATRSVDEMYIYGGAAADAKPPTGQTYVASVEPGTLDEKWRTYLNNGNITNEFYLQGAVYTLYPQ